MSKASPSLQPKLPVIDLFAGPGGLGEGFSALQTAGAARFDVRLSVEKDPVACSTLTLRRFFRQFDTPPAELLAYFTGEGSLSDAFAAHPAEAACARAAVWQAELGAVSRKSTAARVRGRLGGASDWVLLGGPPCQAYSIAGRSRMRTTRPDFEHDERHLLYREYLQVVADHEPSIFVLENVKGLLTSNHAGKKIVGRILDDLSAPGRALGRSRRGARAYRLYALGQRQTSLPWMEELPQDGEEFLLKAEEFGIPQMRHRIFIVGVRSDIPGRPSALRYQAEISASSVLSDLPPLRSRLSREPDSLQGWRDAIASISSYRWMSAQGNPLLVPVAKEIRRTLIAMRNAQLDGGASYISYSGTPCALRSWYRENVCGLTQHEARAHMRSDLHRYLFAAAYARVHLRSPELQHFPAGLQPDHRNVALAKIGTDIFTDRFRVQLRDRPSTTITSHISKDGHYYIHYDPVQCRSLTVREAARLQTFPDSYFFEGTRTQQYHQIGNAVPPLLAMEIARVVHDLLRSGHGTRSAGQARGGRRVILPGRAPAKVF